MKKVYRKLTKMQISDDVIFTSTLSKARTEQYEDTTHIVYDSMEDKYKRIERLENDSFFNRSPYNYNIIRTK